MDLYETLKKLNIEIEEVEHDAVYTIEDIENLKLDLEGVGCKNLFLTNKKREFYLLILRDDKKANIKEIEKKQGIAHLSFGNETYLKEVLNLERGSCSPFGIINDKENKVVLLIDKELKGERLHFHPNRNTATVAIKFEDLIKFIENEKHKYILI